MSSYGKFSIRLSSILAGLLLPLAGASVAMADGSQQAKPLYEIEAFGWGGYTPDYPGADQNHAHFLAVPWLAYRGKYIRTDERGSIQGRIVHSKRFEFDVSASGSFPANSRDNTARAGMPNLDWMGEIGPRARFNLYYWQNMASGGLARLSLDLPVRAVFSTNLTSRLDYRGWDLSPALTYDDNSAFGSKTGVKVGVGPIFGTQELTDYFYKVAPQFATATRPVYESSAGYIGSRLHLSVHSPINDRVSLFGSSNLDYLGGAANENSPLFKSKTNASVLLGLSVSLYRSKELESSP